MDRMISTDQGMTGQGDLPVPVGSSLRNSARVDFFRTPGDALKFAEAKRSEGYNVNGGATVTEPGPYGGELWPHAPQNPPTRFRGLYGVHWVDRKGEGWYG